MESQYITKDQFNYFLESFKKEMELLRESNNNNNNKFNEIKRIKKKWYNTILEKLFKIIKSKSDNDIPPDSHKSDLNIVNEKNLMKINQKT